MVAVNVNQLEVFIKSYLSTFKKLESLIPDRRKNILPHFIRFPHKIFGTILKDGAVIEFKREIGKKKPSVKLSRKARTMKQMHPELFKKNNAFKIGGDNLAIRELSIITEDFLKYFKAEGGTILKIPGDWGILELPQTGDIRLENLMFCYVENGKPKHMTYKRLWLFFGEDPSRFTVAKGKLRAVENFADYLLSSNVKQGIRTEGFAEFDLASEIEKVEHEYFELIFREKIEEQEVQRFLEKHPFILNPLYIDFFRHSIEVKPQKRFYERRRVDFLVIRYLNLVDYKSYCTIVEIKKPTDRPFTEQGKISEPLRDAMQQIRWCFEQVKNDPKKAKREFGVADIHDLRGIIVVGRQIELADKDVSLLKQFNVNPYLKIKTFDEFLRNFQLVKAKFGMTLRQPLVVVGQTGKDEDFTGTTGDVIQKAIDYLSERMKEMAKYH